MIKRPEETRWIDPFNVHVGERYLPPTEKAIKAMMKSLLEHGQQQPVAVHYVAGKQYRLISGATRLEALIRLRKDRKYKGERALYAIVRKGGTANEYKIAELIENRDRRDLTVIQRKEMNDRIRALQAEELRRCLEEQGTEETPRKSKGGRGKKGGVREASRQTGIPQATARDRLAKPSGNSEIRSVSSPSRTAAEPKIKTSTSLPKNYSDALDRCAAEKNTNRSQIVKQYIIDGLKKDGYVT